MGRAWRGASLVLIITAHDVFIYGGNGNGAMATIAQQRSINGTGAGALGHWGSSNRSNGKGKDGTMEGNNGRTAFPLRSIDRSCGFVHVGRGRGQVLFRRVFCSKKLEHSLVIIPTNRNKL
jgi:hypothetical protein